MESGGKKTDDMLGADFGTAKTLTAEDGGIGTAKTLAEGTRPALEKVTGMTTDDSKRSLWDAKGTQKALGRSPALILDPEASAKIRAEVNRIKEQK